VNKINRELSGLAQKSLALGPSVDFVDKEKTSAGSCEQFPASGAPAAPHHLYKPN